MPGTGLSDRCLFLIGYQIAFTLETDLSLASEKRGGAPGPSGVQNSSLKLAGMVQTIRSSTQSIRGS